MRTPRDLGSRSQYEQAWLTRNTWCDTCQQADLGLVEPVEYEEGGVTFIEGKCAKCQSIVRSEIAELNVGQHDSGGKQGL